MRPRHFIIILMIIAGAFALIMLSIGGVYLFAPQALGIKPKPQAIDSTKIKKVDVKKRDTVPLVPSVVITLEQLREFEKNIVTQAAISNDKDSLYKYSLNLQDSIVNIYKTNANYKDSIDYYRKTIADVKQYTNKLLDSILMINSDITRAKARVDFVEKRLKEQDEIVSKKQDTLEKKNFEVFAKMYNNSNPADVAKILEVLDERDASKILKLMSIKKAGKVLEAMKPEQAAAILLLGSNSP